MQNRQVGKAGSGLKINGLGQCPFHELHTSRSFHLDKAQFAALSFFCDKDISLWHLREEEGRKKRKWRRMGSVG